MIKHDFDTPRWRKSSYSNIDGGDCLEIADDIPGTIPIRDSKLGDGPALAIPAPAWQAFVTSLKR